MGSANAEIAQSTGICAESGRDMATRDTEDKPVQPDSEDLGEANRAEQCSICGGELVLDLSGAPVFCDACWAEKCAEQLHSD